MMANERNLQSLRIKLNDKKTRKNGDKLKQIKKLIIKASTEKVTRNRNQQVAQIKKEIGSKNNYDEETIKLFTKKLKQRKQKHKKKKSTVNLNETL